MLPAEVDYLIVGAGARGVAFADEIVHNNPDATVVMVDRRAAPGGHWVDAYPYVRLHQPALFYGVGSMALGSGGHDLASKPEILAYYRRVVDALQATGRCHVLLEHAYEGNGRIRSLREPEQVHQLRARRLVDSVYIAVSVPATRPPPFPVAPTLTIVPPNALAVLEQRWARHVVIGAGKTGMDAILCLLAQGIPPEQISWVVSRDAWLLNRRELWPANAIRSAGPQARATWGVTDWSTLYQRMESVGLMLRVSQDIEPTFFRCATVSLEEVEQLRRISDVIRLGRIQRITADTIILDRGEVPTGPDVLHVDCTANGLPARPARPIFEDGRITLQTVFLCQPTPSAALIARAERMLPDDDTRNRYLRPVPPPEVPTDFFHCMVHTYDNARQWILHGPMRNFLLRNRLSIVSHLSRWDLLFAILAVVCWGPFLERKVRQIARTLPPRMLPESGTPLP